MLPILLALLLVAQGPLKANVPDGWSHVWQGEGMGATERLLVSPLKDPKAADTYAVALLLKEPTGLTLEERKASWEKLVDTVAVKQLEGNGIKWAIRVTASGNRQTWMGAGLKGKS